MLKTGRKEPKQSRSKSTVEAIFGAVTHILNKDGVVHLTTNKIAEVAGVSVGSLYQYFKNKESIFEGIILRLTEENLQSMEQILNESKNLKVRDVITLIVQNHFTALQKMEKVATVVLEYAPKVLPAAHFKRADERTINFLLQTVQKNQVKIKPANPELAFFICVQAVRSVMVMSFLNREAQERQIIMDELIEMLSGYLEGS